MTDLQTSIATLGDIERMLADRDIALSEVKGLRIVPYRRGDPDSPLWLEVKRYLRNDEGERFAVEWPTNGNTVVAYETLRLPLTALEVAEGPAIKCDPKITYRDENQVLRHRMASQIIAEQMSGCRWRHEHVPGKCA